MGSRSRRDDDEEEEQDEEQEEQEQELEEDDDDDDDDDDDEEEEEEEEEEKRRPPDRDLASPNLTPTAQQPPAKSIPWSTCGPRTTWSLSPMTLISRPPQLAFSRGGPPASAVKSRHVSTISGRPLTETVITSLSENIYRVAPAL